MIEAEKVLVAHQMAAAPKQINKRLDQIRNLETGAWLTVLPDRHNNILLSMENMWDNLYLCYGMWPISLQDHCDGCREGFLVDHALNYKKGGLVCI